jgi:flagellar basal-body rod protein FlgB
MDVHKLLFEGSTRQLAYKSLDATALRTRVIAENLANVETPGYQRKEVSFEDQLQLLIDKKLAAERTQSAHMPAGKGLDYSQLNPYVYRAKDTTLPGEINNVDVDMEASKMAENSILYSFLTKFVGFEKLNSAITGRSA